VRRSLESTPPKLSVIVPCRNGERYLERQLDALASQESSFPWEVVFVDNGSTDRSVEIAEAYGDRIRLRVVSAPEPASQAHAQNAGVRAARADKLVFINVDDEVTPRFVAAMQDALQRCDFVASPQDDHALNPEWTRVAHHVSEATHGSFAPFAFGSAIGVSRRALEAIDGCPEGYGPCQDMALSFQLQRSGATLTFLDQPLVRYRFRDTIPGLFNQTRHWGYYEALVYRDFGPDFAHRRRASLALSEWVGIMRELAAARNRAGLARFAVRLGYSVGRLQGSLRYRVFYP
jgi:glycosyltransferase involved in cell wall biosynthesis